MNIEVICWRDAAQWDDDHGEEVFDCEGVVVKSVGFVTRETDDRVYLTRDIDYSGGTTPYRRTIEIPKGMILSRRLFAADQGKLFNAPPKV